MRKGEKTAGPGRCGREAQKLGAAPSGLRPCVPCPILTLARKAVSRPCAPHPLAGGLAASLPERGALRGPALPSLPCAQLPSPAPRPAPAPASPAPPSSRCCLELAASLLPLPQRRPSQTQLCCSRELARWRGAWAGRGESGVRGRDREGWVARSPALLPFCTPCGRQRAAVSRQPGGLCTERLI